MTKIEAVQWIGDWVRGKDHPDGFTAMGVVVWINDNGGEAKYIPVGPLALATKQRPLIGVRTATGWDYAKPGDYVVKEPGTFRPVNGTMPFYELTREVRRFSVCDPETYRRRQEAS